eukprot:TRINITY_DN5034_c0_g5_i1.p1 TRINITY_DN5034_c0_g5~~TRINITY_DN5034_c0_g5_i1.p1  ORF type:complete len:203 (+),score=64.85 TRINITY_DN5034_c0_g5_i1:260-868(+)
MLLYTYSIYTSHKQVIDRLCKRFYIPVPPNLSASEALYFANTREKEIKSKVLDMILQWMKGHLYDAEGSSDLVQDVMAFTQELCSDKSEPWISKRAVAIQEAVKETFDQFNKEHTRMKEFKRKVEASVNADSIYKLVPKGSFIDCESFEFAQQLVLFDFENFKQVKPSELLNKNWESKDADRLAPSILKITQHSKLVALRCQ